MAQSFLPDGHMQSRALPAGQRDALFAGPEGQSKETDAQIQRDLDSLVAADRASRLPGLTHGVSVLQGLLAPDGCASGKGPCFTGAFHVGTHNGQPRLEGDPVLGASIAENLLLVYVQGLDRSGASWMNALTPSLLDAVMPVHDILSGMTRRQGIRVQHKGAALADMIHSFLSGKAVTLPDGSVVSPETRLLAFAGHDTTLDALAAAFGLDWSFDDQPDSTAPDTTLGFEQWRLEDGTPLERVVIFHQSLKALRQGLPPDFAHEGIDLCRSTQKGH